MIFFEKKNETLDSFEDKHAMRMNSGFVTSMNQGTLESMDLRGFKKKNNVSRVQEKIGSECPKKKKNLLSAKVLPKKIDDDHCWHQRSRCIPMPSESGGHSARDGMDHVVVIAHP